jgi:Mrp family chromosome partitioning ATPase
MGSWRLGILSQDVEYVERLKRYFFGDQTPRLFTLITFTRLEVLSEYAKESAPLDLLVYEAVHAGEIGFLRSQAKLLVELGESGPADGKEVTFLAKYQPLDQLTTQLAELCMEQLPEPVIPKRTEGGKMISVSSGAGGTGKTLVAWNLARALAAYGRRVFLLDLQTVQGKRPFPVSSTGQPAGEASARLLYYLKARPVGLPARIAGLKCTDPVSKLDYLESVEQATEMESLTPGHIRTLLQAILGAGYDYVVVDLDSGLTDRVRTVLTDSDLTLWVITDHQDCLERTRRIREELDRDSPASQSAAGSLIVSNRYTGIHMNDPATYGLEPSVWLPYVPGWKSSLSGSYMFEEPIVRESLADAVSRYFHFEELAKP